MRIGKSLVFGAVASALLSSVVWAQVPTTTVLTIEAKKDANALSAADVQVEVDGKKEALTSLVPLTPAGTQVAILLDDSLRSSVGRQLDDLATFINGLKPGVEVMVGYLQNGRVVAAQPFTPDHASAAKGLRLPFSVPGVAASPYLSLSDFAKNWPRETERYGTAPSATPQQKARFVLMITNGVDPYNGSVSPLNQNSPYVQQSITEAQRAGINVYSIYSTDVGIRGGLASFSGQSYLSQVAEATGGLLLYQLNGNPVSFAPYLANFQTAMDNSELATFPAPLRKDMLQVRFRTKAKGVKVRATQALRAGSGEQPLAE